MIKGDRTAAAQKLYVRDAVWRSESFVMVEFSNILATYVRTRALTREQVAGMLNSAEALMPNLATVPHADALESAVQFGISAYDARFIALAKRLGTKLVTEDKKLQAAVPSLTMSLDESLV
jgi:predicted nucleic acid-binding protein